MSSKGGRVTGCMLRGKGRRQESQSFSLGIWEDGGADTEGGFRFKRSK